MRRNRTHVAIAAIALLFGLAAGASAATYKDHFDQTFDLGPDGRVTLRNTNGSVEIESWDRDEVRIEAEKKVSARNERDAQEAFEALEIDIDHSGNDLRVDTRYPRGDGGILSWLFSGHGSASVSYRITVPDSIRLDVVTVNGSISARGAGGELSLRSTNGGIKVYEATGSIEAYTTNGSIRAELEEVRAGEDLEFQTTNGGIAVYLPSSIAASVTARTTNGSITTDFPIQIHGRMSKRRLDGDINGGGDRIDLRTTNGSIRLLEL